MFPLALMLAFATPIGVIVALLVGVGILGTVAQFGAYTPAQQNNLLALISPTFNSDTHTANFTLTTAQLLSSMDVTLSLTGAAGGGVAATTPTAALMIAAIAALLGYTPPIGFSILLTFNNTTGQTVTLTAGTGVTINGTATVANNVSRTWSLKVASLTTVTIQNLYSGTV